MMTPKNVHHCLVLTQQQLETKRQLIMIQREYICRE